MLFKKKVTEQAAASAFVLFIADESIHLWPNAYENLKLTREEKFVVEDETTASFNLFLAAIALSLQGVKNLFPSEQASRIKKWVFIDIKKSNGPQAIEEVKEYEAALQKPTSGLDRVLWEASGPLGNITSRLLHRLLGKNIRNCEAEINGEKLGYIDALLMLETESVLAGLAVTWSWKNLKDKFRLVQTDFPPSEQSRSPKGDESSPEISDEDIPF